MVIHDPHRNLEITEKFKEDNQPYFYNSAITFNILVFIVLFMCTNYMAYLFYIYFN